MKNLKARTILVLLLTLSMGIAPQVSLGGEPGAYCQDPIIEGPPIPGFLTFVNSQEEPGIGMVTFWGTCKGHAVTRKFCFPTDIVEGGFPAITKDHLINLILGDLGPPECYTFCGGEPLIIAKVKKFNNTGERIFAEIVLRFFTCPEPE